ncbi:MAG: 3'(2'),5'-bisphosphate nucleotidase CysQ [Variibacter sp.]|nr:3'(2'),5'-bisphosphate nucleotidase CysQ [Variibacter sp.]
MRGDGDVTAPAAVSSLAEPALLDALTRAVAQAGEAILSARRAGALARDKADGSPVTDADVAAQEILLRHLARLLPGVPVVSEEQAERPAPATLGEMFVLVDPLDGTREFISGRDEFTVNIGVVSAGEPVLGVIGAPALGYVWRGAKGQGAQRLRLAGLDLGAPAAIRARPWPQDRAIALTSRSHLDAASVAAIDALPNAAREAFGSSLKFCRLAEGAADIYPRLAPTMEWDVAAGHALLCAAGGCVLQPDGAPIRYGCTAGFRLPAFIAWGDPQAAAQRSAGGRAAASP